MSAFDTVQLDPITEPIPPEPTFEWGHYLLMAGWLLAAFVVVAAGLVVLLKIRKHYKDSRKVEHIKWMRLGLKQHQKGAIRPENLDVDLWWETLELYLVRCGFVEVSTPSIEEVSRSITSDETLKHVVRQQLLELIALVEKDKYEGKLDESRRARLLDLFVKIYQEFVARESDKIM